MDKITWAAEFTVPPDDRDGTTGVKFEDIGQAAIMYNPIDEWAVLEGDDGCFFVRLHSWDESENHPLFRSLMGRMVKVTIETID